MPLIYEPKGKAREYSPLALNYFNGCDHGCKYCYVPNLKGAFNPKYDHANVTFDSDIFNKLEKELSQRKIDKQVLLSFTGDPYCNYNSTTTSKILQILMKHNIPIAILTKGGGRCLVDLELYKSYDNIKVGATLTFDNSDDGNDYEPLANTPIDRLQALKTLHNNGIQTFVSIEPVIIPEQSLRMMRISADYVDHFLVGKLNPSKYDNNHKYWNDFLRESVIIMRENKKKFYVKKDLLKYKTDDIVLYPNEVDMDYLTLKGKIKIQQNELF